MDKNLNGARGSRTLVLVAVAAVLAGALAALPVPFPDFQTARAATNAVRAVALPPAGTVICGWPGDGCTEAVPDGIVVTSPTTGTHEVHGAMAQAWWADGGPQSYLGYPRWDEGCTSLGSGVFGCTQGFERGSAAWTTRLGAHLVKGAMEQAWWAHGGPFGYIGWPRWDEGCDSSGCTQGFERGSAAWSPGTGAHLVLGAMEQAWWRDGGPRGYVGYPRWDEGCSATGCTQGFERGSAAWSPGTGAHLVKGRMEQAWWRAGGPTGYIGWPKWDEGCSATGCTQGFERGTATWSAAGPDGHLILGAMEQAWWRGGGPAGAEGWPVSDQGCDARGCTQALMHGTVAWFPESSAHLIPRSLAQTWWSLGGPRAGGPGYPIGVASADGRTQDFEYGQLTLAPGVAAGFQRWTDPGIPRSLPTVAASRILDAWSAGPLPVGIVGDSVAAGWLGDPPDAQTGRGPWPYQLARLGYPGGRPVDVRLRARAGATSTEAAGAGWSDVVTGPDLAVVMIALGTNDVDGRLDDDGLRSAYDRLIANAQAAPGNRVIVCVGPWQKPKWAERVMATICQRHGGVFVPVSDLQQGNTVATDWSLCSSAAVCGYRPDSPISIEAGDATAWPGHSNVPLFTGDGFHPNAVGQTAIARRLGDVLALAAAGNG